MDIVAEQVIAHDAASVIEPLMEQLPAVLDAAPDGPLVRATAGDMDEFNADFAALEQAQSSMKLHSADIETLTTTFIIDFAAFNFGGDR